MIVGIHVGGDERNGLGVGIQGVHRVIRIRPNAMCIYVLEK